MVDCLTEDLAVKRSTLAGVIVLVLIVVAAGSLSAYYLTRPKGTSNYITIGTLYASSGAYASSSMPEYYGLQAWVNQTNAQGGLYVNSLGKKMMLKIIAYDDQSDTTTAETQYTNLITVNHVDVLVADFGSVLTAVAVPIAQEHHYVLFDPTGTGSSFFANNPYIALTSLPTSALWPDVLGQYINSQKANISKIAIVYSPNDFDQSQATTLNAYLTGIGITPVYYQSTSASSAAEYLTVLQTIKNTGADALIEFGYPPNDISTFQALQSGSLHFNFTFTVFPGQLLSLMESSVPSGMLNYTWTYPTPPLIQYNTGVNLGPTTSQFVQMWKANNSGISPNFLNIAGYNAGLIIGKAIETAGSLSQSSIRTAVQTISGNVTTLDGQFVVNSTGAQIGETLPVGQLQPTSSGLQMVVVYPLAQRTGTGVYPAP